MYDYFYREFLKHRFAVAGKTASPSVERGIPQSLDLVVYVAAPKWSSGNHPVWLFQYQER